MAPQAPGFSLIELLCCLALLAGVLGWGAPTFSEISLNTTRNREVTRFVQAVYLARSEAIKRNGVVSLCPSQDGATCGPVGTAWHEGWTVFVNDDRDVPATRDAGETLLRVHVPWNSGLIVANRATLSFRAFGQTGVTATLTFCDRRGSSAARAVIISQSGRPRVSTQNASGGALSCV
jgi:type IV fimbrial biogenesis protein FimT